MTAAISADNPLPGYYWMRREKGGRRIPIAIWRQDGELVCRAGPDMVPPLSVWTWCADNKVDKEAAKHAFAKGFWPDEAAPLQLSNLPSDPFEALKIEIEAQRSRAEEWLGKRPTVMTQVDCDLAVNLQKELLALNKRADAMFKAEKAPLLDATSACDTKFAFRATVADVAEKLRKVFGRFMAEEEARQKAEAAAQFKAEQAKIAAERARIEAEAKQRMVDDPVAALTEAPPEMPELPLGPESVKVQAGGGIGRKAGLRTVWVGTVTDYHAAALFFIEHPKLKAVVDELAQHQVRDLKDSAKIPGVTVTRERRAA